MTYLLLIPALVIITCWLRFLKAKEADLESDKFMASVLGADNSRVSLNTVAPDNDQKGSGVSAEGQYSSLQVMENALTEMGCQPSQSNDGTLFVSYQGENFHMEFGGPYVRIWDPFWAQVKADDPDWPNIRDAINSANFNFGPTVVYTKPNDEGIIGLHCRRDIMLHPSIPDTAGYVRATLDSFFQTKDNVKADFQRLMAAQQEQSAHRRPVGFTSAEE